MHEKPKKHILKNISKILSPHEAAKTDIVAEAEQIIENYLCKMGYGTAFPRRCVCMRGMRVYNVCF